MSTRNRKKVVVKKKTYAKKGPSNKQLATRIKKLEHSEELKYADSVTTSTWVSSATVLVPCAIGQGDDVNQRVGEEIIAKYLNVKVALVSAANVNPLRARFMVFWDLQANGEAPGIFSSDVGIGPSKALIDDSTITTKWYAPLNYRTKHRYTVLMDKMITLNPQSSSTQQIKFIKKNLQLGGAKIKYSDSGATGNSLTSRALYCYGYVPSAYSGSYDSATVNVRFWYTDS